jgi:hypothetical protein
MCLWLLCLLAASGCQSLEDGAKDDFVQKFTCPKGRVEVRPRPDLSSYDLTHKDRKPPADVAADPERLALWKKKEAETRRRVSDPVFELRGCAHSALMHCTRANTGSSSGRVMCFDIEYPPGLKPW